MVGCCLKGCGARKNKKHPSLTLHKFPVNETLRNKWLEIIGPKNINHRLKHWFVCSLHFEENCFNRTLYVVRLYDGAVPSSSLLPKETGHSQSTSEELISDTDEQITISSLQPELIVDRVTNDALLCIKVSDTNEQITISSLVEPELTIGTTTKDAILYNKIHQQNKQIDRLKRSCISLRRKVKCLNEKVRRCNKKIAKFSTIIKDLKNRKFVNTDESLILEECTGPEDLLRRHIAKSKGLPLKKKYSEQLRKFASTLHYVSPRAYEYVRKSYKTCLPHSRTLSKWRHHEDAEPDLNNEAYILNESQDAVIFVVAEDEMAIEND